MAFVGLRPVRGPDPLAPSGRKPPTGRDGLRLLGWQGAIAADLLLVLVVVEVARFAGGDRGAGADIAVIGAGWLALMLVTVARVDRSVLRSTMRRGAPPPRPAPRPRPPPPPPPPPRAPGGRRGAAAGPHRPPPRPPPAPRPGSHRR